MYLAVKYKRLDDNDYYGAVTISILSTYWLTAPSLIADG